MDNTSNIEGAEQKVERLVGDLTEAYLQCRRNKRSKRSQQEFESGWASHILSLAEEVVNRSYVPETSITFIVRRPKLREVFAASFRDRVIHHYIAIRLEPLFEKVFIHDTYNCRKGKGTLYGVMRMHQMIEECSEHYTKDCWVAKFDIKGFFMSINKPMLWNMLRNFINKYYEGDDMDILLFLVEKTVLHNPENNCILHSPIEAWKDIPKAKSLFTCGKDYGLPIGNITSQMFANFLLWPFDLMMDVQFRFYGRYVDDFFIIETDKRKILKNIRKIRGSLKSLGLVLHPQKMYLQHYSKGLQFTGGISKPDRHYICNSTVNNFEGMMLASNSIKNKGKEAERFVCRANSYLGFLIHHSSYAIRRRVLGMMDKEWWNYIYIGGHYERLVLKREYREKTIMSNKIKEIRNYGKNDNS